VVKLALDTMRPGHAEAMMEHLAHPTMRWSKLRPPNVVQQATIHARDIAFSRRQAGTKSTPACADQGASEATAQTHRREIRKAPSSSCGSSRNNPVGGLSHSDKRKIEMRKNAVLMEQRLSGEVWLMLDAASQAAADAAARTETCAGSSAPSRR
jgi:hypothetical protein